MSDERYLLPIYEVEPALRDALQAHRRVVISAPTGSGKSTQVPQMLLDGGFAGDGRIIVLQPRRLPARMLATHVARQRGARLGGEVGYQIRFENQSGRDTRIKYETEGLLLRQLLNSPNLGGVSAVVLDEFHERHLHGDVTLGRMLQIQKERRPDLIIIVMSATLEVKSLTRYLDPCAVLESEGRMFPVETSYAQKAFDDRRYPVWQAAVNAFEETAARDRDGDTLIFMPGAYEIRKTLDAFRACKAARGFDCMPLHGELPAAEQDKAVEPGARRKVIVSTNVAETSLTIDGITTVIDSGLARIPRYDPHRGINTLLVGKISRASADQRMGRAGRTRAGRCLRLWTEADHRGRALQELPEVKRLDLSEVLLTLKASGVDDLEGFPWMEPPEEKSLGRAVTLLTDLGAFDDGRLTETGKQMAAFPTHPRYARMLMEAGRYDCVRQTALIAALSQGKPVLQRKVGKDVETKRDAFFGEASESDFFRHMSAWSYAERMRYRVSDCAELGIHAQSARQAGSVYESLVRIARKQGLPINEHPPEPWFLQRCILAGFSDQLAMRVGEGTLRCRLVHGRKGELAKESAVKHAAFFVASEIQEIDGRKREMSVKLSLVTAVEEAWLRDLFPDGFREETAVDYDPVSKRIVSERRTLFRDLVLSASPAKNADPEAAAKILADLVEDRTLTLKKWDGAVEKWIQRVNCLHYHAPELGVPAFKEEDRRLVTEQLCLGAAGYKDIKEKPVQPELDAWLGAALLPVLERFVPERIQLPRGRRAKVKYDDPKLPTVGATIQDLYGVDSLKLGGRIPLRIEILAPSRRPVQTTTDLSRFWKETYPEVKKELKRRYPKHEWR